ncbi:stage II sporulation protein D [Metabacillus fastidiosus]|uniref:stage II sporulation protein D n=1 Tax=Metabacillus fastidiosus TaxID=1458 RepID=UPI002E1BFB8B|nr:stage II sporulation protein D [Metabacillus fastidiosus]MED4456370.1 stage II sporulation protein D [Metabacillus fastidiosus]
MFKPNLFLLLGGTLFIVILIVPTILVVLFSGVNTKELLAEDSRSGSIETTKPVSDETSVKPSIDSSVEVTVYRSGKKIIEKFPLDQYLIGVIAGEMPAEFEPEALKAQVLTARTYYIKRMLSPNKEKLPQGAQVIDTVDNQVFINKEERKEKWGSDYQWKENKISKAVKETDGKIITYNDSPIEATFFSTSNGYTENAEDYWNNSLPYLKSVKSSWDKISPSYMNEKTMSVEEFERRLGVNLKKASISDPIAWTEGKRVKKIEIGGKVLTGKEVREQLNLKSSDFNLSIKGKNIVIKTKGSGHGVGLSQYGANGMASEGKKYEEIIKYYYQNVEIASGDEFLNKVMAKR